jgi:hypothetical protein
MSDTVTMVGGKREDRSYRLQREAVAVAPPPPPPPVTTMPPPTETKPPGLATTTTTTTTGGSPTTDPAATVTATPAPTGQGGDHSNLRPYAWGVGIAAGVGLAFGAVEGIVAIKKRNEFNNHMGPDPISGAQTMDCGTKMPTPACKSIQDSWSQARTLSIVGFVAGAALAGGAAALWFISAPKEHGGSGGSTTALACAPNVLSPGVACRLEF